MEKMTDNEFGAHPAHCPMQDGREEEDTDKRKWRIDKSASMGQIATVGALLFSALWWTAKQESRIEAIETQYQSLTLHAESIRVDSYTRLNELKRDTENWLIRIEDKLDKVVQIAIERKQDRQK